MRRELANNFCFYQHHYDSLQGAWEWACKTLLDHASDKREHIYTREQLEKAKTADPVVLALSWRVLLRFITCFRKGFSVVLSDMCPLVSGITTRDAALSVELGMQALDLAVGRATLHTLDDNVQKEKEMDGSASDLENEGVLLTGGHPILRLLESEYVKEIGQICKPLFRKAPWLRPKATRSSSREIYLICQGLQQGKR